MAENINVSYEDAPCCAVHKKIAAGTFMGQISDGYTLGIVGIALSYAVKPLGLSSFWMGLIGAGSMFGIFFGSLIAGVVADKIGRKPLYSLTMILMILLSLSQYFLSDPAAIATVRFLLGVVIGTDYTAGIALLNEWAPARKKASYLAWLLVFWTIGYCIAYIVGFFMDGLGDNGWRWVLCTSAVPALLGLLLRTGSPESPKWLMAKGRVQDGLDLIHRFIGASYGPAHEEEKPASASWFALFSAKQWRKTIVSGVFFFAQVLPFFSISIFLPLVLGELKITNPTATGVLYNVFTIAGVLLGTPLVSVVTRRSFLIGTFYLSAALLVVLILAIAVTAIGSSGLTWRLIELVHLDQVPGISYMAFAVSLLVGLLANFVMFFWMLTSLPRGKVPVKSGAQAALIGAVAFEVFKQLGSMFFSNALKNPAGATFGPIIGVMVLFYFVWRIMLYCSAWAATTPESLAVAPSPAPAPAVIRVREEVRPEATRSFVGAGVAAGALAAGLWSVLRRK